jgi:hypothetical protein
LHYDIEIEVLEPRRRRATVEIPDGIDDPAEYLRAHPQLWTDRQAPAERQDIARIHPAIAPEPLDPDLLLTVSWITTIEHQHRAAVTVGELREAVLADHFAFAAPLQAWCTVLDINNAVLDDADSPSLSALLAGLEESQAAETEPVAVSRYVHREVQAGAADTARLHVLRPTQPGPAHRQVAFEFTETSHGHGHIDLADLEDAGGWTPGRPVTADILQECFGTFGADRGSVYRTDHAYTGISYTAHDDPEDGR